MEKDNIVQSGSPTLALGALQLKYVADQVCGNVVRYFPAFQVCSKSCCSMH